MSKIVSLIIIFTYNLPIVRLSEFPVIVEYANQGWWIGYLMVGVLCPLLIAQLNFGRILFVVIKHW